MNTVKLHEDTVADNNHILIKEKVLSVILDLGDREALEKLNMHFDSVIIEAIERRIDSMSIKQLLELL